MYICICKGGDKGNKPYDEEEFRAIDRIIEDNERYV
jgi:hypothetical protein